MAMLLRKIDLSSSSLTAKVAYSTLQTRKVKEFYNATSSMADSSAMDTEINNKCFLVPNCEIRSWSLISGNSVNKGINTNVTKVEFYIAAGSKV